MLGSEDQVTRRTMSPSCSVTRSPRFIACSANPPATWRTRSIAPPSEPDEPWDSAPLLEPRRVAPRRPVALRPAALRAPPRVEALDVEERDRLLPPRDAGEDFRVDDFLAADFRPVDLRAPPRLDDDCEVPLDEPLPRVLARLADARLADARLADARLVVARLAVLRFVAPRFVPPRDAEDDEDDDDEPREEEDERDDDRFDAPPRVDVDFRAPPRDDEDDLRAPPRFAAAEAPRLVEPRRALPRFAEVRRPLEPLDEDPESDVPPDLERVAMSLLLGWRRCARSCCKN